MNKIKILLGIFFFCLTVTLLIGCFGTTPVTPIDTRSNPNGVGANYAPPDSNWSMMWSDEFNGSAIDSGTWTHETGDDGWGNNELQNYTANAENSYISNEKLVIEAKYIGGSATGRGNYTSARMISQDKYSFQYGLVVARMKSPYGAGVWPAIWMLGQSFRAVGWPRSGEIDIFEMFGQDESSYRQASGAMHWFSTTEVPRGCNSFQTDQRACSGKKTHTERLANNFHNYSLEWNENELIWRFDGEVFQIRDITDSELDEFRAGEFFLLLNVAVGGNPVANPDISVFPQTMEIDWIRVYTNKML